MSALSSTTTRAPGSPNGSPSPAAKCAPEASRTACSSRPCSQTSPTSRRSARRKAPWEEAFGAVVVVNPFDSFDEAVDRANGTRFGLQAGVFTRSLDTSLDAADRLEFGGVIINEAPTFRSDQMPYGGVKASGNTKEGPAWAVSEMTEERLVVIQR